MVILKKLSPSLFDWVYLMTVKSQLFVIGFVIIFSLSSMDIYHNVVLFWFIWGVLQPKKMSKKVIYVSYYAGFFLIGQYIYTLVPQFNGNSAECFAIQQYYLCSNSERIMYTIGLDSNYNPISTQEYFRYTPPLYEWIFALAVFVQLRRQQLIGTD